MPRYVLDTSALVSVLDQEPGAESVLAVLDAAAPGEREESERAEVYLPFMALMELEYLSRRRLGVEEAEKAMSLIAAWPVEVVESTPPWRREAARIKASYSLSIADAWICSLAVRTGAQLVHKDPEYDAVDELESLQLPYKA